jgi:hypothetical protein
MTAKGPETTASPGRNLTIWGTVPGIVFAVVCVLEIATIFGLTGAFGFTLDDAYIHLSLAENIASGHYGVNPAEVSSPSSSPLWALLLVPFEWLGIGPAGALILNLVAGAGVVLVTHAMLRLTFNTREHPQREAAAAVGTLIMGAATNLVPLVFMGMEHTAQVLCAVAVVLGLVRHVRDGTTPWWLFAAIILGPLIRYENLAVSVPAIIWLSLRGVRLRTAVCAGVIGAGLAGFSLFLVSLGLDPLPNSVLAKASAGGDFMSRLAGNFGTNLVDVRQAVPLLIVILILTARGLFGDEGDEAELALWGASAGLLHMVAGRFGWYSRYEIYIWAALLLTTLFLLRKQLIAVVTTHPSKRVLIFSLLATFALVAEYVGQLLTTPLAAANIHDQQRQLHHLVVDHLEQPVAANDIGWLTYRNPHRVLDIVGLASQEARINLETNTDSRWIDPFVRANEIEIVLAYEMVVRESAAEWVPIATLSSTRPNITPASDTVWIYAVTEAARESALPKIRDFSKQLPPTVELTWIAR